MSPKVVERHLPLSRVVLVVLLIIASESTMTRMNLYAMISLHLLITCLISVDANSISYTSGTFYYGPIRNLLSGSCIFADLGSVDKNGSVVLSVILL